MLPSKELITSIEQSEKDYMIDRMTAIKERDGNPERVELAFFGDAACFYSKTMPWPSFNTVKGFSNDNQPDLKEMIHFFRSRERKPQFEIVPSRINSSTLLMLSNEGYVQTGFHTSMHCVPEPLEVKHSENIQIRGLQENEFATYAMIHCLSTGLGDNGIPHVAANNQVLYNRPGWKFYIAHVSGQPAAVSVMFVKDGIASLTFAATLPQYRNLGIHQYLLRRRINDAHNIGCSLAVSQCAFLSGSHRNMEQIGMRIGYIKTIWTEGK